MRNWHPLSKLSVVVGLAGLGLLWLTDYEVASGTDRAAAVPVAALDPASADLDTVRAVRRAATRDRTLPPVEAFAAMVERPLFASDRRPIDPSLEMAALPPPEWEPMPAAGPQPPAFRFIGSVEENGTVRAIVSDGIQVRGLTSGERLEGWSVVAIETRRLVLGFGDERLELTILE